MRAPHSFWPNSWVAPSLNRAGRGSPPGALMGLADGSGRGSDLGTAKTGEPLTSDSI